jgi:hypothetical protein
MSLPGTFATSTDVSYSAAFGGTADISMAPITRDPVPGSGTHIEKA